MAIPIAGYSVVVKCESIESLLEGQEFEIPNATTLDDKHIWCCGFMAERDAHAFLEKLTSLGLNVSQGPDSDGVLVSEFDESLEPYCEWLHTARWEKAVIAWRTGTKPKTLIAHEGWDPKVGSGLTLSRQDEMEFVRLDGNVEVFKDPVTGQERYLARTEIPTEAICTMAGNVVKEFSRTAGDTPVTGEDAEKVQAAVEQLKQVLIESPEYLRALWFHGKGLIALGQHDKAYLSLQRAYEIEKDLEVIPRELAGVCLELGKFDEAVTIAERAASLKPDDEETIGNLAVSYLLAGRVEEAAKSIAAALKLYPDDNINLQINRLVNEVVNGVRSQPTSMADLFKPAEPAKRWWEFWK